ncbi:MAG: pilus assembly protein PilM [Planctomycetes bacterium]|nr:pilus assembly protein PilM [Planctomycetota bacterium]
MRTLTATRRTTTSPIGLDIGATGARAVQLLRSGRNWTVVSAVQWPLRRSDDRDDALAGLQERFGRALREDLFVGRAVVVGLSQPDVELHALELPDATGSQGDPTQIESAARWEIERLCRFEEGATQTAHWRLPRGRGTQSTALGVAVQKDTVQSIWNLCRRAGADCQRIDATACALSRAGTLLRPPNQDEVWGVLDVGARAVRLILCVDQVPVVARSLDGGGVRWTQKIVEALGVGTESAELHKCDHGLRPVVRDASPASVPGPAAATDRGPLAELAGMISKALRSELDRLIGEVERSYEYVLQCYSGRQAADLILTGGGAALKNLDVYLGDRLGIPVRIADAYLEEEGTKLTGGPEAGGRRQSLAPYLGAIGLAIDPEGEP